MDIALKDLVREAAKEGCLDPKKDTEPIHGGFYIDCFECFTCKARYLVAQLEEGSP